MVAPFSIGRRVCTRTKPIMRRRKSVAGLGAASACPLARAATAFRRSAGPGEGPPSILGVKAPSRGDRQLGRPQPARCLFHLFSGRHSTRRLALLIASASSVQTSALKPIKLPSIPTLECGCRPSGHLGKAACVWYQARISVFGPGTCLPIFLNVVNFDPRRNAMTDYPAAISPLAIQQLRCPKCRTWAPARSAQASCHIQPCRDRYPSVLQMRQAHVADAHRTRSTWL